MADHGSVPRALSRVLAALVAVILVAGAAGYMIFRVQTPVSLNQAIERFRAANDGITSRRHQVNPTSDRAKKKPANRGREAPDRPREGSRRSTSATRLKRRPSVTQVSLPLWDVMPAEGVYSYVGRGEESIWPVPPRKFPRFTQRLITHEGRNTWVENHLFSEERESWTRFSTSETGRLVHHQRNYIAIGHYEEDKIVPFHPPILALKFPPRVGHSWGGVSKGETNDGESYTGTWTVEVVADEHWTIGGTRARVVAYEFDIDLEGEFNGTVAVNVWLAPRYGLTVREEYDADAMIGPLKYNGKWFVELRSLEPRT